MSRNFSRSSSLSLFASLLMGALLFSARPEIAEAGKCPNVHLIMDRSGSMSASMGASTRWVVAKDNLKSMVALYDGVYPMGLTIFPAAACDSTTPARPAYSTASAIGMGLDSLGPMGGTPSGTAMRDVAMLSELRDASRPQYVVMLTDGGPACSGEPDSPMGTANEINKALMQTPSIVTFVIGVGMLSASESSALELMAAAGGRPHMGATKYYPATSSAEMANSLTTVMLKIAAEVGACSDAPPADLSMPEDLRSMPEDLRGADLRGAVDLRANTDGKPPVEGEDLSGTGLPPPVVDWIEPRVMAAGLGGPAEVTGRNFIAALPSSQVLFDSGSNLSMVQNSLVIDGTKIKVVVPADLPPGTYDVVVKNPDGQLGRAIAAFTVGGKASGCDCSVGGASSSPRLPSAPLFAVAAILGFAALRARRRSFRA